MTPRRLKVAIAGGAQKIHVRRWAAALASRDFEVRLFSDVPPPKGWDSERIPVVTPQWGFLQNLVTFKLRGGPLANNRDKWQVYRNEIRKFAPDILHAHEAIAYGPMLPHFPEYQRLLTPWGPDVERLPEESADYQRLLRAGAQAADCITTNAPGLEDHWREILQLSASARLEFFTWGTDISTFSPRSAEEQQALRRKYQLPAGPIHLSPRLGKPYYRIKEIAQGYLLSEAPGSLVLLGAGGDLDYLREVQELDRERICLISGVLTPDEMAAIYSLSESAAMIPETDLVASSLIEAIACGTLPLIHQSACYKETAVSWNAPREDRALAAVVEKPEPEQLAAEYCSIAAISMEERNRIREHNLRYAAACQDWEDAADRMAALYWEMAE